MKKMLSFLSLMVCFQTLMAQVERPPVNWEFHSGKVANNLYEVDLVAIIDKSWHIYPTKMGTDEIGMPTTIIFTSTLYLKAVDTIAEKGLLLIHHDKEFDITSKFYEKRVIFSQYFSFRSNVNVAIVKGTVQYQACTMEKCLPPIDKPFSIMIKRE